MRKSVDETERHDERSFVEEMSSTDRSIELLERRGASTSGCEVLDHNDGTYTCNAVVLATGRYTLHLFLNERPAARPWPFTVRPGMPDAATSELKIGQTLSAGGCRIQVFTTARPPLPTGRSNARHYRPVDASLGARS